VLAGFGINVASSGGARQTVSPDARYCQYWQEVIGARALWPDAACCQIWQQAPRETLALGQLHRYPRRL
jgi:hypothetical protein